MKPRKEKAVFYPIMSMEGGGFGMPDTTVEPSGGVLGLIYKTLMKEGACLKTPRRE